MGAAALPGPDRGALSVPGEESERFRANVEVAADFAQSLGCTALNALYGNRVQGVDPAAQDALALENLTLAARAAHRVGATLLIEALNAPESPACPIVSAPKAIEVVDAVNAATGLDNARFLMDLYHLARNGEDLEAVLGIMGAPMAENLLKAGYPVTGHTLEPDKLDRLATAGGTPAASIAEAVAGADVIVTMVPASPQVEAIAYGPDGILANARRGALLIDMSSITPQTSVDLAAGPSCAAARTERGRPSRPPTSSSSPSTSRPAPKPWSSWRSPAST